MRLLQIHEPGQTPDLHEEGRGYVVGIDLGTTNSVVAYSEEQMPRTLSSESGASLLPSIVSFQEDLQPKVGEASSPLTIRSVKRLMGLGRKELEQLQSSHSFHLSEDISEDDSLVYLKVGDRRVTPQEVSAEILRDLKKRAEVQLEGNVDRCVLTVPAHFDEAARKATKDAAKLAGMEVLRLINEPTAAALAYGLENGVEGIYAVYDLGGGTFDVSLLKLQKGVFQVLATGGDPALGGDDFDVFVLDSLLELHGKRSKDFAPSTVSSFLSIVRCGKEELTSRDVCHVSFPLPEGEIKCSLSRSKLEELISDSVERTLKICREVLQTVSLNPAEVQGVILVGGSTRIPYVQKAVSKCFEQDPYGNVNPDEVVAHGAAIQAEALTSGAQTLLLDVTPLSLGVEIMGEMVDKIIPRNSPIPASKSHEFTTSQDGQTAMAIHIVQGEREFVKDCRSLGRFELRGIPPMGAGKARIKVQFTVDADGLLSVSAREETTGAAQSIDVRPTYGLTQTDMEKILAESYLNGSDDIRSRLLLESKIKLEADLNVLSGSLKTETELLNKSEFSDLTTLVEKGNIVLRSSNREEVEAFRKLLDKETCFYAERQISSALKRLGTGTKKP